MVHMTFEGQCFLELFSDHRLNFYIPNITVENKNIINCRISIILIFSTFFSFYNKNILLNKYYLHYNWLSIYMN